MQDALRKRKVADVEHGEKIAIPTRGITEPMFHHSRRTGRSDHVVPGNKEYVRGDEIPRPQGGGGGGGREGSPDGSGEDAFEFTLSKEEFLDMFFEDLELPDLVKKTPEGHDRGRSAARRLHGHRHRRPISASRARCAKHGAAHLAEAAEARRARGAARGDREGDAPAAPRTRPSASTLLLERSERRSKIIPYIDPIDVRYRRFERVPKPNTEAVMFCLMDVSGSMTEAMKDLAKRFFMLLHVFLIRRYRHVDVVFIRHTSTAEEVDEETFFYSRETGGTVVSTALEKMLEIARARYPTDRWNIYGGAGLGRRQLRRRQQPLRLAAGRRGAAALPVFRLCRGRRRHRRQPHRPVARQRSVARLQRGRAGAPAFRDAAGRRSGADLLGVPRALCQRGRPCLTRASTATTSSSRRDTPLFTGPNWDFGGAAPGA